MFILGAPFHRIMIRRSLQNPECQSNQFARLDIPAATEQSEGRALSLGELAYIQRLQDGPRACIILGVAGQGFLWQHKIRVTGGMGSECLRHPSQFLPSAQERRG